MGDDELLTRAELCEAAGISLTSLAKFRSRGTAPAPDGYFSRTPYWRRSTVEEWLAERTARWEDFAARRPS